MSRPVIHASAPSRSRLIVASDLLNGWALRSGVSTAGKLIRTGDTVTWALPSLSLDGTAATASIILELPLGYRVGTTGNYGALGWVEDSSGPVRLGKDFARLSCSARSYVSGIVSWPTLDPWPTT